MLQLPKLAMGVLVLLAAIFVYRSLFDADRPAGIGDGPAAEPTLSSAGPREAQEHSAADRAREETTAARGKAEAAQQGLSATRQTALSREPDILFRLMQSRKPLAGVRATLTVRNAGATADESVTILSDAGGLVECFDELRGAIRLALEGEGVPHGWSQPLRFLRGPGPFDLGEIHVPRVGSVAGRVLNQMGQPLPKILVRSGIEHAWRGSSLREDITDLEDPRSGLHAWTDEHGRFSLAGLGPGKWELLFESPVYGNVYESFELEEGRHVELDDIQLELGLVLRGRVITETGSPVAGASIMASQGPILQSWDYRGATKSQDDGSFELRGVAQDVRKLRVECAGYLPEQLSEFDKGSPLRCVLQRSTPLIGTVLGAAGRACVVRVQIEGDWPAEHYSALGERSVDADGRFRIEGLEPGKYRIEATCEGLGRGSMVVDYRPDHPAIELRLASFAEILVTVHDDQGTAVAGARVVRDPGIAEFPSLYRTLSPQLVQRIWRNGQAKRSPEILTNESGQARLRYPRGEALALAAGSPQHIPDGRVYDADAVPKEVELQIERAAVIHGRLTSGHSDPRIKIYVVLEELQAPAGRQKAHRESRVDAKGRYRLAGLQAGVYTLQVQYFATSPIEEVAERLQGNPLLENGVDSRLSREIQLEAAVEQRVDLELPPLGRIEGSVLLAGEPVAGAIVLAVPAEQTSAAEAPLMTVRSFDGEKAHHWLAFDKTGADGSYCLYSSKPGSYDLRVRQPGSAGCSEPVLVRLPKADSRVRQDLELPGGTLRAQYLLSSFDAKALRSAKAYLLASDIARANPSYTDFEFGGAIPLTFELTGLEPDALGRVEFRGLRPGAWVLRLMSQFDKTLDVREVVIGAHESVDLGTLEARKRHALDLLCESTKLPKPGAKPKPSDPLNPGASFGVFVYQPSPSQAQGYFVAAVYIAGNRVRPHLAPGRYLCELRSYVTEGMSISFEGEAASKLIPLTVRPDGSTDPAVLRF